MTGPDTASAAGRPTVPGRTDPGGSALAVAIVGYTAARLLLIAVVTLVVYLLPRAFEVEVPLVLALLIAIVLQLPMAWLLLPRQRYRVTEQLAARTSQRRTERDRLRAALSGDGAAPLDIRSDELPNPRS